MTTRLADNAAFRLSHLLIAGVALGAVLLPVRGEAGFEIRGAGIPRAAPQSGPALQSDTTLAPIGMMPDALGQPTIPVTAVPIDAPTPVDQAVVAATPSDVLSGFGTDLPLVIALQQVAPAGYQFSFAPGVDPGQRVSWQGGKPWGDVARDMLSASGLGYELQDGHVLMVVPQGVSAPVPLLQTAQVTPPAAPRAPQAVETADVRRQKPSPLIGRIRAQLSREDSGVEARVAAETEQAVSVASMLSRDEALTGAPGEDLSPIVLSLSGQQTPAPAMSMPVVRPPVASANEAVLTASTWQADAGMTLRDVMQDWAGRAGVDLYWSIDYDYRLRQPVSIEGNFADATAQLLDLFAKARPRPYAQLHRQGDQPRTLVVKAYGVGY